MSIAGKIGKYVAKAAKQGTKEAPDFYHKARLSESKEISGKELKELAESGNPTQKYYSNLEVERREMLRELKSLLSKGDINKEQFDSYKQKLESPEEKYAKGGMVRNKGIGASMKPHDVFNSKKKK